MSLLIPDTGLLFWMTLSFAVVLGVLGYYAFPMILRAIEQRSTDIAAALDSAKQAEAKLVGLDAQAAALMEKAQADKAALLKEAADLRASMLEKAAADAEKLAAARMERAKAEAEELRRRTLDEAMEQIAGLSVKIAEKVVGEKLEGGEQQKKFIDRLLKEEQENV